MVEEKKHFRIDVNALGLDDVAISDVTLFRLERMSDDAFWIRLECADGRAVVIWLTGKDIRGKHEVE